MAEKPIHSSMAMTADIHSQSDGTPRSESEYKSGQVIQKPPLLDTVPKKKSTFKITSVKKSDQRSGSGDLLDGDGDSLDDLDESHTEDASSDILDVSKGTEYDLDNTSETGTAYNLTPDDTANKEIVKDEKTTTAPAQSSTGTSTTSTTTTTITTESTPGSQQSRFKVVKIETKEPFRRGRWTCYDFLDTPANVHVDKSETKPESRGSDGTHSGNSSAASSVHYVHGVDDPSKNPLLAANLQSLITLGENQLGQALGQLAEGFQPVGQTLGQLSEGFQPVQSISKQGTNVDQAGVVRRDSGNTLVNLNQTQSSGIVNQQLGQSNHVNIPQTLGNQHIPQNITNLVNSAQTKTIQSSNAMQQPGSQQPVYNSSNQSTYLQNVALAAGGVMSHIPPHSVSTNGHSNVVTNVHEHKRESSVTADVPKLTQTAGASGVTYSSQQDLNKVDSYRPDSLHVNDTGVLTAGQLLTPLAAVVGATGAPSKYTKDDSSPHQRPQEIKPERNQHGNIVNQSGSSTVAIDNKIEQAMDLVKSHLMFAVREEVEVLKEQIKELIEKNDQLLYENSILRAAASQETLSKLSQPRPQSSTSTS